MTDSAQRDRRIATGLLIGIMIAGWLAYAPALSGSFALDDLPNLSPLASVDDRISALRFVFSGTAGPLGRPIALATFLPQADAWADGPRSFFIVNILIHLANAALLAAVLLKLSLARGIAWRDAAFVALAAAAVWMLMPILASSSLVVVQRMTTLSTTFVLLGLLGYLQARQALATKKRRALVGMASSLVVATLLAALTKENGALMPTLVLVLEATVLGRPSAVTPRTWYAFAAVFLWLPTVLVVGYLVYRTPYGTESVLVRDFTSWERLFTEARILWAYVFKAFVPAPGLIAPYNDGYPVSRSALEPLTLLAILAWVVGTSAALLYRRRYPLGALAVLWFLAGHLLESTTLPLELYFDHRNYLPLIGPVYAVCSIPRMVPEGFKRAAYGGLSVYALVLAAALFSLTTRWGHPEDYAEHWYRQSPQSVRAATGLATRQLAASAIDEALATLHQFVAANPRHGYLLIQDLNLACLLAADADHTNRVARLDRSLPEVGFSLTAGRMLSELLTTVSTVDCKGVDADTVRRLADALHSNPRYRENTGYTKIHHGLMAKIHRAKGDMSSALRHLERASSISPSVDIAVMRATSHVAIEDFDGARRVIRAARAAAPWHPVRRFLWSYDLDNLGRYVDAIEAQSDPADSM